MTEQPVGSPMMLSTTSLTMVAGEGGRACAVGPIGEQSFSSYFGSVCLDAFGGPWPTSLGRIDPIAGATNGGIRATLGAPTGVAAITGQSGGPASAVAQFTPSFESGVPPEWTVLDGKNAHHAKFLTRAGDGSFFAGLTFEAPPYAFLELHHLGLPTPTVTPAIACAATHLEADAAEDDGTVIVATSSGRTFGSCSDDDGSPTGPTRLQVVAVSGPDSPTLLYEEDFGEPLLDVRMEDAGDAVWVVVAMTEAFAVRRLLKTGDLAWSGDGLAPDAASRVFDVAMLGDQLLVAYPLLQSSGFGLRVEAIAPDGDIHPLGEFEAELDPLSIALTTSPTADAVVVAYRNFPAGQVVARRFDCVSD